MQNASYGLIFESANRALLSNRTNNADCDGNV